MVGTPCQRVGTRQVWLAQVGALAHLFGCRNAFFFLKPQNQSKLKFRNNHQKLTMNLRVITPDFITPIMAQAKIIKVTKEDFTICYREYVVIEGEKGKPMTFLMSKELKELKLPIVHFKELNRALNKSIQHVLEVRL